jgi:drug/metabolite transporter (DMT)-like permease
VSPPVPAPRARIALVLAAAVLAISSSALLVRGMAADPLAIAAWRTLGASLVLGIPAVRALPGISRRDVAWCALSGVLLGAHFWAWFASVQLTTVLRSTLLVCLTPGWTLLLEAAITGRRPRGGELAGLALALPGLALLAGDAGRASLIGDALATFAGALWSAYLLVGREVRARVDAGPYMALVCGWASAALFAVAFANGTPLGGWPSGTWGLLALAVALPQLVGHQGFAWALRHVSTSTLSALTLLEPVGAALLAAAILGETPAATEWLGMAIVLLGTGWMVRAGVR